MPGGSIENSIMKLLQKFFTYETSETIVQLVKSLFAGGVATLVDYGVFFVLSSLLSVHYIVAGILSFIVGLIVNYIITSVWVFSKKTLSDRRVEFAVFTIIALVGLGLNVAILWITVDKFMIHEMIAKVIATIIVYGWNFTARKLILYR